MTPSRFGPASERKAWAKVAAVGRALGNERSSAVASMGRDLETLAKAMLVQVAAGVHRNPPSEAWEEVATLSPRVYEIRYRHAEDGVDYRHPFRAGAHLKIIRRGRQTGVLVVHPDGLPLAKDFR